MDFTRRTTQLLHEDHRTTLSMIENLQGLMITAKKNPPDTSDASIQNILKQAITHISREIGGHFSFEEDELFTRLADFGDEEIGNHLRQEHQTLLPIARQVAELASSGLASGFDGQSWAHFKDQTGKLCENLSMHIQKEEMALLPMLEELLDPETDMELATLYSQGD